MTRSTADSTELLIPSAPDHRGVGALCALLTGVMTFIAFPTDASPELTLWWLIWVSHVPILWWLKDKTPRQGFWWGYLTGIIINTGGYYWIGELIITFGHLPIYIAALGLLLHSMLVGLIWGVWGATLCALAPRWGRAAIAPLAMMASEYIMPRIFEAHMGDSQYPAVQVMQIADLFGMTAVTGLIYLFNASLADALERRFKPLCVAVGALALTLAYGHVRMGQIDALMEASPKLKIGLVEANVGIYQAEPRQKILDDLLTHQRLSAELEARGAELIVWPESALRRVRFDAGLERFHRSEVPLVARYQDDLAQKTPRQDRYTPLRGFRTPLLFGSNGYERPKRAPGVDKPTRALHYNRAWLIDAEGEVLGSYDKVHRLMFGEYIPFGDTFPIFYDWIKSAARVEPGEGPHALKLPRPDGTTARLGVLNCYEGIIPSYNRKLLQTAPDVLINVTNDDWFNSVAQRHLHFALAIPRSIESRRVFLRATLTGVSAVVDANGRVLKRTALEEPETLLHETPLMRPWTLYASIGDLAPQLALMLMVIGWVIARREEDKSEG